MDVSHYPVLHPYMILKKPIIKKVSIQSRILCFLWFLDAYTEERGHCLILAKYQAQFFFEIFILTFMIAFREDSINLFYGHRIGDFKVNLFKVLVSGEDGTKTQDCLSTKSMLILLWVRTQPTNIHELQHLILISGGRCRIYVGIKMLLSFQHS